MALSKLHCLQIRPTAFPFETCATPLEAQRLYGGEMGNLLAFVFRKL
jgi:hypothetical protein